MDSASRMALTPIFDEVGDEKRRFVKAWIRAFQAHSKFNKTNGYGDEEYRRFNDALKTVGELKKKLFGGKIPPDVQKMVDRLSGFNESMLNNANDPLELRAIERKAEAESAAFFNMLARIAEK